MLSTVGRTAAVDRLLPVRLSQGTQTHTRMQFALDLYRASYEAPHGFTPPASIQHTHGKCGCFAGCSDRRAPAATAGTVVLLQPPSHISRRFNRDAERASNHFNSAGIGTWPAGCWSGPQGRSGPGSLPTAPRSGCAPPPSRVQGKARAEHEFSEHMFSP